MSSYGEFIQAGSRAQEPPPDAGTVRALVQGAVVEALRNYQPQFEARILSELSRVEQSIVEALRPRGAGLGAPAPSWSGAGSMASSGRRSQRDEDFSWVLPSSRRAGDSTVVAHGAFAAESASRDSFATTGYRARLTQIRNVMRGTTTNGSPRDGQLTVKEREAQVLSNLERLQNPADSWNRESKLQVEGFMNGTVCRIVESRVFDNIVTALILANAIMIGAEADWKVKHAQAQSSPVFHGIGLFFTVVFCVELMLRVAAHKSTFFSAKHHNFRWNAFDSVLVALSLLDEALTVVVSDLPDVSAVRVLRSLRLVRVVRVVRMARFFRDLRIMIWGIFGSMKSLAWAMILLSLIGYVFAIGFLEFVANALARLDGQDPKAVDLRDHFGGLSTALYTLFKATSNGEDWGEAALPLIGISPVLAFALCIYIAIAVFCVLNVVTGVFVENAMKLNQKDEQQQIIETLENQRKWILEVKDLFRCVTAGSDDGRVLKADTFVDRISDMRVQAHFKHLGLTVEDRKGGYNLFQLLDFGNEGQVGLDDFAAGIQMLHGNAKSIDMARVQRNMDRQGKQLARMEKLLADLSGAVPRFYSSACASVGSTSQSLHSNFTGLIQQEIDHLAA